MLLPGGDAIIKQIVSGSSADNVGVRLQNLMAQILTITLSPTIDVSGDAEVVRPTRKTRMSATKYEPGGGGINVARVISILGGDVKAVFLAGGEMGNFLDRLLKAEGIHRCLIPVSGQTRVAFMVRERSTGLEYRFIPEGTAVREDELKPCFEAIATQGAGYVISSGSLPAGAPSDTFARMADRAGDFGLKFVLDSSGAGLQSALDRSRVFLVKPSRGELEQYAGGTLDDEGIARAALDLVKRGTATYVAVTLGADGAILASANGLLRLPAIHVRVRSAVGAGDSFLGAMVLAMSQGKAAEDAFRFGMAAGAAAAMTAGTELCKMSDVLNLYRAAQIE
jgi:6-phosphofructokinase 2